VLRLEKRQHCEGVLTPVEQPSVGALVAEEAGDDDGPPGRLLALAVMPLFCALTRTLKNFLLSGAPRGAPSP
jgi:hypothetical protein